MRYLHYILSTKELSQLSVVCDFTGKVPEPCNQLRD